jgi:hypothetical protein
VNIHTIEAMIFGGIIGYSLVGGIIGYVLVFLICG